MAQNLARHGKAHPVSPPPAKTSGAEHATPARPLCEGGSAPRYRELPSGVRSALAVAVGADLEHRQERLLGHLDPADLLHALLAFLLLLEQLALARDVAAVALGDHVLAHRLHRL